MELLSKHIYWTERALKSVMIFGIHKRICYPLLTAVNTLWISRLKINYISQYSLFPNCISVIQFAFLIVFTYTNKCTSLVAQTIKNLPAMQETWVWSLGQEDPLQKGMATHSSILAWRIPIDRGAWWATVHRVTESDTAEWLWFSLFYTNNQRRLWHTTPVLLLENPMDRGAW